jgi:Type I phosphodiesterase / nucleotide pyrophosphatase
MKSDMNAADWGSAAGSAIERGRRLHIFVLIDALGWEIIKNRPFLNNELPFRQPLETVLGYSSGAIPTILTGLHPAQTGHWNLYYYDPKGSPFRWLRWFGFLPERLFDNRISRKLIKELGRRVFGLGPLFECGVKPALLPLFNFVEKQNIYSEGGIPNSVSIFDLLHTRGIAYRVYSYHQLSDSKIVERACSDIQSSDAKFFFLYLSEMDHFLHSQYNDVKPVADRLAWYDQQLREVFRIARRADPEMTFTVISDHGMTPVHSQYDLVGKIEALGFSMPKDYLSVYDSTMARYWFFNDAARNAILGELSRTSCGRILDDSELERLGILFPDRRYGEVVFLLDPGYLLATSDFNGDGWHPVGMHGYHPSDSHSDAIFLSNQAPRHQMSTIADIYPCLEEAASPQ